MCVTWGKIYYLVLMGKTMESEYPTKIPKHRTKLSLN